MYILQPGLYVMQKDVPSHLSSSSHEALAINIIKDFKCAF